MVRILNPVEPGLGLSSDPGCAVQPRTRDRAQHDCGYSEAARDRANPRTTWKEFLNRHWELIVAADVFTVEMWTRRGLQRFVVLFIELSTRRRGDCRNHSQG
jgi:hypothetical protein